MTAAKKRSTARRCQRYLDEKNLLLACDMGLNLSVASNTVTNDVDNAIVTNVMLNIANGASAAAVVSQEIDFSVTGSVVNCGTLVLAQTGEATVKAISRLDSQNTTDVTNQLTSKLRNSLQNQIKQKNAGVNLGQFNVSSTSNDVHNRINNSITNNIATVLKNYTDTVGIINQKMKVNWSGSVINGTVCKVSQDATISSIAQSITDSVNETVVKNSLVQQLDNDLTNAVSQVNEGLFGCGDQIVQIVIILAIVAAVGGGGVLLMKKKKEN